MSFDILRTFDRPLGNFIKYKPSLQCKINQLFWTLRSMCLMEISKKDSTSSKCSYPLFGFCALPNSIKNFKSHNYRSVFVCQCSLRSCFVVFPGRADLTAVFLHWSRIGFPQTISGYSAIAARTASSQVRLSDTIEKGFVGNNLKTKTFGNDPSIN